MKTYRCASYCWVLALRLFVLLALPRVVQAQWEYTTNNGTITITKYTGSSRDVTIPDTINDLPVTGIGDWAFSDRGSLTNTLIPASVTNLGAYMFQNCTGLTSVTIGNGVTFIGWAPFASCSKLMAITVDPLNPAFSSMEGVLFNKSRTTLIAFPGGKSGSYTVPAGVTSIGDGAFITCTRLTSVTIGNGISYLGYGAFSDCTNLTNATLGNSVTSIGGSAFASCASLTGVYFKGNAPILGSWVFAGASKATVYYLPGTTGWRSTYDSRPTAPWYLPRPLILSFGPGAGAQASRFGFTVSWATNAIVVVEAATSLTNSTWLPVASNALTAGSTYLSDTNWQSYPNRFYRLRSP